MDQTDDSIFPEASHLNGTSEVGMTGSTGVTEADPPATAHAPEGVGAGIRPGFLAELAVAMRSTAEKERERIAAKVADDASAHVDKVRARAAIETDELRRLAEEDVQHIEDWSAAEMQRIRGEADQKIDDRRSSLDEYLKQHDSIIDTEIDGVNDAVRDYNTTLDGFFAELAQSDNPASIVARAESLPPPPDLDEVRALARARAVAMFADQDDDPVADPAPVADQMNDAASIAARSPETTVDEVMVHEPEAPAAMIGSVESSEMIEATAEPAMEEAATAEAVSDAPTAEDVAPAAEEDPALSSGSTEPIPVMDPAATADTTWPAPEPEPEPVAAAVDHTSAAVRLLRSVAPWTAPTNAGSNDRSDSD